MTTFKLGIPVVVFLVMPAIDYVAHTGIAFNVPIHPGATPVCLPGKVMWQLMHLEMPKDKVAICSWMYMRKVMEDQRPCLGDRQ
jgi:hypothetical protein